MNDLFQLFLFFIERSDHVVKLKSVVGLGFFLQRYGQYLVEDTVRQIYHTYLLDRHPSAGQLRCQVLINLEEYFRDCIRRMAEHDVDYLHDNEETIHDVNAVATGANLKETADVHSEMASSIAQCYLHVVLETYLSEDEIIRQCVRKVVSCILEQGLVHPVQFIPYLIAMTTDRDINIQQSAEQNLQDLDKTNPGIIQTKVMHELKMSYQLQKLLTTSTNRRSHAEVIRGKRISLWRRVSSREFIVFRHDKSGDYFVQQSTDALLFCQSLSLFIDSFVACLSSSIDRTTFEDVRQRCESFDVDVR